MRRKIFMKEEESFFVKYEETFVPAAEADV